MISKMEPGRTASVVDIYLLDYAGRITLETGLSNIQKIQSEIRRLPLHKNRLRLIFDIRRTIWETTETHDSLSRIARQTFHPDNFEFTVYTAVLNNEIHGSAFENEHWFTQEEQAIQWLRSI